MLLKGARWASNLFAKEQHFFFFRCNCLLNHARVCGGRAFGGWCALRNLDKEKLKWKYMTPALSHAALHYYCVSISWNGSLPFNSSGKVETTKLKIGISGTWARQSFRELNHALNWMWQLNLQRYWESCLASFVVFCKRPLPHASSEKKAGRENGLEVAGRGSRPCAEGTFPFSCYRRNKEGERKASWKSRYFLSEIGWEERLCGFPYGVSMRKLVAGPHCISQGESSVWWIG